ncbi:MAG: protein kinase [Deltaproteobacteria bacterium]|nr:protein kinase [Deltaproteobacteria bacterium]
MNAPFAPRRLEGTPYRLDSVLGEGAMGEVYLGEHVDLRRPAVIKLIKAKYANEEQVVGRMRREARIVARIRHDALVTIYDLGVAADGRTYIAMEYLEGTVLRRIQQTRGALPVPEAVRLMVQACEGIEVAHQAGVIHRDIKPENLFVTSAGQLKVLDFGVAKPMNDGDLTSARTAAGMVLGTPRYMAPEQATGRALSAATDVYAVGCVLFELLTGTPAVDGADAREMLWNHLHTRAPTLAERARRTFDPELEAIVARALAKDPAQRFPRAADLAAALRGHLERARPSAAPPAMTHDKPTVRVDDVRALVDVELARRTVHGADAHGKATLRVEVPAMPEQRASFAAADAHATATSAYDDTRAIAAANLVGGVSTTERSPVVGVHPASVPPPHATYPVATARTEVLSEHTPPGGTGSLAAEVSTAPLERRAMPLWPVVVGLLVFAGVGTALVFVVRGGPDRVASHEAAHASESAPAPIPTTTIALPEPVVAPDTTASAAAAPTGKTLKAAGVATNGAAPTTNALAAPPNASAAPPAAVSAAPPAAASSAAPSAVASAPTPPSAYDKARSLMNDGDLDAAEREARAAIATHGNTARLLLGEILEKKGKPALARDVYQKVLEIDPNNGVARTRLAKLGG